MGTDHNSCPTCLGKFGIGKKNENGKHLLESCCHQDLGISNTFFNIKPQYKVSWRHPRSKHWHQLDSILNRRPVQSSVKLTCYQSADCDSDVVSQSSCCRWACITPKRKTRLKSTPIRNALKTKWKSLHKRLRISSQVKRIAMPVRDGNISGMLCAVMPFSSSARR